jgi:hypothetical protein
MAAELHAADDPGEGFTLFATAYPDLERLVVGCCRDELVGLLVGGDATGRREPADDGSGEDRALAQESVSVAAWSGT